MSFPSTNEQVLAGWLRAEHDGAVKSFLQLTRMLSDPEIAQLFVDPRLGVDVVDVMERTVGMVALDVAVEYVDEGPVEYR